MSTTPARNPADPALPRPGDRVLVHGLGRFGGGRGAVRYLVRRGCRVRVADKSRADELLAVQTAFAGIGDVEWRLGDESEALLDGVDAVVVSPAIPDGNALLTAARRRSIACTQEIELFLAAYPGRVIGITGTNGKSSTAMLLHRALVRSGRDALLGGNIGHSLLADEADWRPDQVAVLELSSFQLERLAPHRRVHGAVFTRVTQDHVDRHGSIAAYHRAKARLAQAASDFVVHAADDPVAAGYASDARVRGYFKSDAPGPSSCGIVDAWVMLRPDRDEPVPVLHTAALRLLGDFQRENVMAASLAAAFTGADAHAIGIAMATAAPLPFRLQLVATVRGVRVYDNGVSTEYSSTQNALATLVQIGGKVHWVGGGKSKDGDFATVADAVAPLATSAHLFGAAAAPLSTAIAGRIPTTVHATLHDAVPAAFAAAEPGDAVLFSPAFASFDQYPNFRARALEFHALLRERDAAGAQAG